MRTWVIAFILAACGHPEDPALDIVRLPQSAYGPFDAAIAQRVAPTEAGAEAGPRAIASAQIDCFVPEGDPSPEDDYAPAPFDNCPTRHEDGRFNEKATSQRRNRVDRDTCCYSVVRRPPKVH